MSPKEFPPEVVESLLVKCHRYCCLCHKFAGTAMEIHHIDPEGPNTEDNGIPLCLLCHQEVGAYNPKHPKGRKFTPSELKKHRDQWFTIVSRPPFTPVYEIKVEEEPPPISPEILDSLKVIDRITTRRLVASYISKPKKLQALIIEAEKKLDSPLEDTRWLMGQIFEEIIEWDPCLVKREILEKISRDKSWSVRSSAAYSYYLLASADPGKVPIQTVARLASPNDDYYVHEPASACLKRLAKTRILALDILFSFLRSDDPNIREYGANNIHNISVVDPISLKYRIEEMEKEIDRFSEDEHITVRNLLKSAIENIDKPPLYADYSPF